MCVTSWLLTGAPHFHQVDEATDQQVYQRHNQLPVVPRLHLDGMQQQNFRPECRANTFTVGNPHCNLGDR